jgi:uncharacterized protein YbjT (DUF2867 family)
MILVTGGTGTIGRSLVQLLKHRGVDFKVMARKEETCASLREHGIQGVIGDFTKSNTWGPALRGIKTLFLLTVANPDMETVEGDFLEGARKAGVQKVVRLSAMGANPHAASPLARIHGQCELRLEKCGLDWTILRPTMFMQNFAPMYGPSVAATSTLYAPAGEARIPFVDTRDIAAAASIVLTSEGHEGFVYELTGGEALTYAQVSELLSAKLGRIIKFVDVPDDAAYQSILNMGGTPWFAHGLISLFHIFKANGLTAVAQGTVARLIGRHPRTIGDYLQEHLKAFQPAKAHAHSN